MATKYYEAHNAARDIAGERFEITDIVAGTAIGVFETSDEAKQIQLDKVVECKRGVNEISEAEYDHARKKKASSFSNLPHSNQIGAKVRLSSRAGVVAENGVKPEEADPALESVEGALGNLDQVDPPRPETEQS